MQALALSSSVPWQVSGMRIHPNPLQTLPRIATLRDLPFDNDLHRYGLSESDVDWPFGSDAWRTTCCCVDYVELQLMKDVLGASSPSVTLVLQCQVWDVSWVAIYARSWSVPCPALVPKRPKPCFSIVQVRQPDLQIDLRPAITAFMEALPYRNGTRNRSSQEAASFGFSSRI